MNKFLLAGMFAFGVLTGGLAVSAATSDADPGITGIGGIFYKVDDPEQTRAWYRDHLGLAGEGPYFNFFWKDLAPADNVGFTVWSLHARNSDYFGPGDQPFMINYRVRDLDALLARLSEQGIPQVGDIDEYDYGRFAWVVDSDGYRIELWEPTPLTQAQFGALTP